MSSEVKIAGHGGCVVLSADGYENPDARDRGDANWLSCGVQLTLGGVAATHKTSFTTNDFARFLGQLRSVMDTMKGAALFVTDEDALSIKVELGGRGTGTVSGVLRIAEHIRATVEFSFESDQTFLVRTLADLDGLCRKFPIKT